MTFAHLAKHPAGAPAVLASVRKNLSIENNLAVLIRSITWRQRPHSRRMKSDPNSRPGIPELSGCNPEESPAAL